MDDLKDLHPDLEREIRRISFMLEHGSHRDRSRSLSESPEAVMSLEKEESDYRRLNDEWHATLEKVRQLDGFGNFLRPSRLSTLRGAAANGPVVAVNVSKTGPSALILTVSGVEHIPLPELDFTELETLVRLVHTATGRAPSGRQSLPPENNLAQVESLVQQLPVSSETSQFFQQYRAMGPAKNYSHPDDIFRLVLATLWTKIVRPIIRSESLKLDVRSIL
jgi:hypothetical protein